MPRGVLLLFGWAKAAEGGVEELIVEDFECAGDEEGGADQGRASEKKSGEKRADGRARGARNSGESARGGALFGRNDGHRVGLSRGDIHLADAEPKEKHQHRERKI